MQQRDYYPYIILAIITTFGLLLRLYQLDWQCYKVDELVTAWAAAQPTEYIIRWSLSGDYNPPLYYLLAHWSSMAFGEITRFSIRFPAVIFGTLAIPMSYFLGKEMRGITLGLLVASLVSFMFPFFFYSQDARAYPLVLFGFIGVAYFFVKLYNGKINRYSVFGLAIFAALCFYSHFYSIVPIAILGMFLLLKHRVPTLIAVVYTALLSLPMALLFNSNQFVTRTNYGTYNYDWMSPTKMAAILPNEMFCWSVLLVVPLALYALYRYNNPILRIFAIAGVITPALLIPLATLTGLMPRYAILVSPIILAIAMYPVSEYIDHQKTIDKKIALFSIVVFVFFLFNYGSIVSWTTFNICPLMTGV